MHTIANCCELCIIAAIRLGDDEPERTHTLAASVYYIQNEARIRGKNAIDLTIDPPPDLVIEIDITSGSLEKFPIYAAVGVPEIWRYDGQQFRIHRLTHAGYIEAETSSVLPLLTRSVIVRILNDSKTLSSTALICAFRERIRALGRPGA